MSVLGVMNDPYFQRAMRVIQTEWFPKHQPFLFHYVANVNTILVTPTIDCVIWSQAGTTNYLVVYLLRGSTLIVTGDIGHAIYRWTPNKEITLPWIAHCNYSYFAEKLEGMNGSIEAKRWDPDHCEGRMNAFIKEYRLPAEHFKDWKSWISTADEWSRYVMHDDCGLGSDATAWGYVPDIRSIGHWLGLRMAFGIKTA